MTFFVGRRPKKYRANKMLMSISDWVDNIKSTMSLKVGF